MTRRTIASIAALAFCLAASACSSGNKNQREDETKAEQAEAQPVAPKTGVVASVDDQRLLLDSAADAGPEPELFERTSRSVVMREGSEVDWSQLEEGDVVRVTWDRGIFGPDRVAQVEVLEGPAADRVRQEMETMGREPDDGIMQPMQPREIDPGDQGMSGPPAAIPGEEGTQPNY